MCVKHRAKQDARSTDSHAGSTRSAVSFDFGYLSRERSDVLSSKPNDGKPRLVVMFAMTVLNWASPVELLKENSGRVGRENSV